jgi:predicted small secreted protein
MSRTLLPLAALAMVALITAGCSNAPAGTGASSDGGNTSAAREQALKFAQCMRNNGIREFPDPDASGTVTIETIANGTSIDTNSPAFQQAITACKDLEPAGFTGATRTPEQQQAALKFAQCIRDNGVKDFPDPAPDAPMIDTNRIPSTDTPGGMTILHAAMQKCGTFARDAGVHP